MLVCFWMIAGSAPAQEGSMNMEILGEKVRADRKLFVAEYMALTDAEAQKFWPLYDQYVKELGAIGGRYAVLIQSYADNYRTMNDATARTLLDDYMACETQRLKLQQDYLPKFRSVLPDKKVTRYYQVENKIRAVMTYELAKAIPLVN
jgi:hypothetical protein